MIAGYPVSTTNIEDLAPTDDVIIDAVDKSSTSRSKRSLKKKGFYLSTINPSSGEKTEKSIFLEELIEAGKDKIRH